MPVVIGQESQDDWTRHVQSVHQALQPATYLEIQLADRVAFAFWRLNRIVVFELAAIEDTESEEVINPATELLRHLSPAACLLPAREHLDRIVRYEAHLNRVLYQALHELEAQQERRRGQAAPLARVEVHGLPEG